MNIIKIKNKSVRPNDKILKMNCSFLIIVLLAHWDLNYHGTITKKSTFAFITYCDLSCELNMFQRPSSNKKYPFSKWKMVKKNKLNIPTGREKREKKECKNMRVFSIEVFKWTYKLLIKQASERFKAKL